MKAANDSGPRRYVAQQAIDMRELAEHFGIEEDRMREFCLNHEREISELARRSAIDFVEDFGKLEGIVPLMIDESPEGYTHNPLHHHCSGSHADEE